MQIQQQQQPGSCSGSKSMEAMNLEASTFMAVLHVDRTCNRVPEAQGRKELRVGYGNKGRW
ncbi:hypothetical protein BDN71DRAFT_1441898 [Pleurotus eryngii]|uniref:Uncharacterized protein n=1 Tax=Pleurotus eryngii TaxID=5323 RepID=A0A9P6DIG5_PLEER|nr:hypothetical protein BDN71DRAFT_1441898 [Pleurotus eryngii]